MKFLQVRDYFYSSTSLIKNKKRTFFCGTGVWTQSLHLESLYQPIFVLGIFEIGSHKLFAWVHFQTKILLISAYWVARITGANYRHPSRKGHFKKTKTHTNISHGTDGKILNKILGNRIQQSIKIIILYD
jgi:hypothetical protein